jgi:hypothetical protein
MFRYYSPTTAVSHAGNVNQGICSEHCHITVTLLGSRFLQRWGDITPCSPVKVTPRFGGTYGLHLQDWRVNKERNQQRSACCLLLAMLVFGRLTLRLEMEGIYSSETWVEFHWVTRHCILKNTCIHITADWTTHLVHCLPSLFYSDRKSEELCFFSQNEWLFRREPVTRLRRWPVPILN